MTIDKGSQVSARFFDETYTPKVCFPLNYGIFCLRDYLKMSLQGVCVCVGVGGEGG